MAIPSSGPVSIGSTAGSGRSINVEVGRTQNTANSSMTDVVTAAVVGSTPRGEGTVPQARPHQFSEWHEYVHVVPNIWSVGTGGTETNYAYLASNGNAALTYGIQANVDADADNTMGNTMRIRVVNSESSGVYTSNFAIWLHNTHIDGNVPLAPIINNRISANGTTTVWSPQAYWKMYQAEWTSSTSIADACPDTWNINWSTSTTTYYGDGNASSTHGEFTSGTQITSCDHDSSGHAALNFSDNTDHSYNNTAGVDTWASRFWKDTTHTDQTTVYWPLSLAQSFSTITFDVTFKKSGFTDTSSTGGGWKWLQKSQAVSTVGL